jgi:hypothetical protein
MCLEPRNVLYSVGWIPEHCSKERERPLLNVVNFPTWPLGNSLKRTGFNILIATGRSVAESKCSLFWSNRCAGMTHMCSLLLCLTLFLQMVAWIRFRYTIPADLTM